MLRIVLLFGVLGASGAGAPAVQGVAVDAEGMLRWQDTGAEAALFGVNYYPPPSCRSMRHRVTNDVRLRGDELAACDTLRLRLRVRAEAGGALGGQPVLWRLALSGSWGRAARHRGRTHRTAPVAVRLLEARGRARRAFRVGIRTHIRETVFPAEVGRLRNGPAQVL